MFSALFEGLYVQQEGSAVASVRRELCGHFQKPSRLVRARDFKGRSGQGADLASFAQRVTPQAGFQEVSRLWQRLSSSNSSIECRQRYRKGVNSSCIRLKRGPGRVSACRDEWQPNMRRQYRLSANVGEAFTEAENRGILLLSSLST
jgi:hypothetical protein